MKDYKTYKINLFPDPKVYDHWEIEELGIDDEISYQKDLKKEGLFLCESGDELGFKFTPKSKRRPVKFLGYVGKSNRSGLFQFLDKKQDTYVIVDALTQGEQIVD